MSTPDRVAVVVVHGIADQHAGQTVRELARLLCHGGAGEPRYVQGEMHEVLVPVARLEPGAATPAPAGGGQKAETARQRPGTPSGFYQAQRSAPVPGRLPISLVTVGSPLRDLYAERFPLLYRWMGSNAAGFATAGPRASDVGAVEWVNACRSGDYVGRFLWTPAGHAYPIAVVGADGKVEAARAGDRTEFCLGAGAHTHYFSDDAVALAVEIDRLIEG